MLACLVCSLWPCGCLLGWDGLLCVVFSCVFVSFSGGVLCLVWCLVVSIPDFCLLHYFENLAICIKYLRASKGLDMSVNTRSLIDASVFLTVFTLYIGSLCVCFVASRPSKQLL